MVASTREGFDKVDTVAGEVAKLIVDIASSNDDQAQGLELINRNLAQMETVTASNASQAQAAAAASGELDQQAAALRATVEKLVVLVGMRLDLVGQGGMGAIYQAEDLRLEGRQCAIKEVVPNEEASKEYQEQ